MKLKNLFKVSFYKTVRFNCHYFGFKGIFRPFAIIAKGVQFKRLSGKVIVEKKRACFLVVGFPSLGIANDRTYCGVIDIAGTLIIRGKTVFGAGSSISIGDYGMLDIGGLNINGNTKIICNKSIKIGEGCLFSWGGYLMDCDFHRIYQNGCLINCDRPIVIGDSVWLGMNSVVLKGAQIPSGSVVAAGSIVTKVLPYKNTIYKSNKILKRNIEWKS